MASRLKPLQYLSLIRYIITEAEKEKANETDTSPML